MLTIAGDISNANRAAFDETTDTLINYHDKTFEKAADFDIAMLESLGMHEAQFSIERWPWAAFYIEVE